MLARIIRGALAGAIATVPMTFVMEKLGGQPRATTLPSRFGTGALCGALYALTFERLRLFRLFKGPLFGAAIWLASDFKGRSMPRGLAHLVWGASLARLIGMNRRQWLSEIKSGILKAPKGPRFLASAI